MSKTPRKDDLLIVAKDLTSSQMDTEKCVKYIAEKPLNELTVEVYK